MLKTIGRLAIVCAFAISPICSLADTKPLTTELNLAGQQKSVELNRTTLKVNPSPSLDLTANGYILMDYNSGQILASKNPDEHTPPASLTKMMTMYIVSNALKSGQIKLDDTVRISEKAWRTGGSKMFVKVGTQVPVRDLVKGIIIASGNDACVALAEQTAGTEGAFADLMNQAAAQIGMTNSHFMDSTGLPNDNHYSSPRDIAILSKALIRDFPDHYEWYKQKWFSYNDIKQPNRNRLLWHDETVDGIKTGHTDSAGFCLAASAMRNNVRLIAVVMGSKSDSARASDAEALLNYGFRFYESRKLFDGRQTLNTPRTWGGEQKTTPLGLESNFYISVPSGQYSQLKASVTINKELKAPILVGQQFGTVNITLDNNVIASRPLIALKENPKGGIWARSRDKVVRLFNSRLS